MPSYAGKKLIAAVLTSDIGRYRDAHRAMVKMLAQKGFDQSKVDIVVQTPNPDPISWANTIRKFNGIGADVMITYGAPISLAATREANNNIPIVFVDVYGPVETGITRSMTAPGRNITGVTSKVPMITLVKTANDIKRIKSLGVLYNSREIGSVVQLKELKRLAGQMGFSIREISISTATMLESATDTFTSSGVDFIYAAESTLVTRNLEKVITRAREHRIPVISHIPDVAEKGALVALEIDKAEQGQLAGEVVAGILHGKRPGQLPVAAPKKVELVINLKAAKQLEMNVPLQVLNQATKILK